MPKKPLPIGIDDFQKIRSKDFYYVDKSMIIVDIVRDSAEVILLPRPRRFGKSLNMSMLRYFYDIADPTYAQLFEGLAVSEHQDAMAEQGRSPVIYLSFKHVKKDNFRDFLEGLAEEIADIAIALFPDIPKDIHERDMSRLKTLQLGKGTRVQIANSLKFLTEMIHRIQGRPAVILIDEYDIPIQAGYQYDYFEELINFMRDFLSAGFKGNPHLSKGVITGVLRVAKESIFSGLNNLRVYSILNKAYSHHFGFTEEEVTKILTDFGLHSKAEDIRHWYNGYTFGNSVVYNPWSILNYVKDHREGFQSYWVNSGSDTLIRELVLTSNAIDRKDLTQLINHQAVTHELDETVSLRDFTPRSIWSLLTFSGYLKPGPSIRDGHVPKFPLSIPNYEVWLFWNKMIRGWVEQRLGSSYWSRALHALRQEDVETFAAELQEMVIHLFSFHDTAKDQTEAFYHAFFLGLLSNLMDRYELKSNRESGHGRYDLALIPCDAQNTGFLFEFKRRDQEADLQSAATEAIEQIRQRDYAAELRDRSVAKILAIGVALDGKFVAVQSEQL